MKTSSESEPRSVSSDIPDLRDTDRRQAVLDELERVLQGKHFRNSGRAKQFLQFIVEKTLEDHSDELKERRIGAELFHRSLDYSTGDDPVVRVQAGLVRRRLEQHYQEDQGSPHVRIEVPLGSYAPEFQWLSNSPTDTQRSENLPTKDSNQRNRSLRSKLLIGLAVTAILILGVSTIFVKTRRAAHQESMLEKFWSPALATQRPILICLGDRVSYRPKQELYDRYRRQHPGTFETETEKTNIPLPLDPTEKISWGDMDLITEWGITKGDLAGTATLATFLGRFGKSVDLKVGAEYSYRDLREFPAILLGAFNNQWTMNLMSDLRYVFVEQNGKFEIQDKKAPGQIWFSDYHRSDYAIICRLLDPKTGQFTVIVAGLASRGTEAAGEFVTSPSELEEGLHAAPQDWQSKNLELVLETDVTEGVSGPPHVIASYYW